MKPQQRSLKSLLLLCAVIISGGVLVRVGRFNQSRTEITFPTQRNRHFT